MEIEFSQNDLSLANLASKNMKKLQSLSLEDTPGSSASLISNNPTNSMLRTNSGSTYNTLAPIKFPNLLPIDDGNENLVSDSSLEAMYASTNHVMNIDSYYSVYKQVLQNLYPAFWLNPFEKATHKYQTFVFDSHCIYDILKCNIVSNNVVNSSNHAKILVLYTGLNSNKFLQSFENKTVDVMYSNVGTNKFDLNQLKFLVSSNDYQMICLTYVDESIGVKVNLQELFPFLKEHSKNKNSLLVLDCNGAISSEPLDLNQYPFDLVFDDSNDLNGPQGVTFGAMSSQLIKYLETLNSLSHFEVSDLSNLYKLAKSWELVETYGEDFSLDGNLKLQDGYDEEFTIKNDLIKVSKVLLLGFNAVLSKFVGTDLSDYYTKCYQLSEAFKMGIQKNLNLELVTDYKEDEHALVNGLTCVQYLNSSSLIPYLLNSFNLSLSEGKIKNMKLKTSLSKIDINYFRIKNIQPIIVRDFINSGSTAENYTEYKILLSILKKSIEAVDYTAGKKGYSSVSLAETL
ncbi:hypothetical protein QEN19_003823 [Hanseniaspora menglaensis]